MWVWGAPCCSASGWAGGRPHHDGARPGYLPDWAALKPQYEALEHGGVTSAVNVWHRVCQDNYKVLVELWNENPRNCAAMAKLVESAADPGPISGPAREEWEKEQEGHE